MLDERANGQSFGNVAARSVDGDFHGPKSLALHVPMCPSFFLPS
jgi:hypothetical protein